MQRNATTQTKWPREGRNIVAAKQITGPDSKPTPRPPPDSLCCLLHNRRVVVVRVGSNTGIHSVMTTATLLVA